MPDLEVTLEANRTSVEAAKLATFRTAGHQALAARETASVLFPRVSFDMIYARPDQGVAAWRAELEALQGRATELCAALDGLNTAVRMFAPDTELDAIGRRRSALPHTALPGQTSRAVLGALRDASQPLTTRELTLHVMARRGVRTPRTIPCS